MADEPGFAPRTTPYITVRNARAAMDFYVRAFGFEPAERIEGAKGADGDFVHVGMTYEGALAVMFAPDSLSPDGPECRSPMTSGTASPASFHVVCRDVAATVATARAQGAAVESEPQDMFWGERMATLRDPDGYRWAFAEWTGKTFPMPPIEG